MVAQYLMELDFPLGLNHALFFQEGVFGNGHSRILPFLLIIVI